MNTSVYSIVSVYLWLCGKIQIEITWVWILRSFKKVRPKLNGPLSPLGVRPGTPTSSTVIAWLWIYTSWVSAVSTDLLDLWGQLWNGTPLPQLGTSCSDVYDSLPFLPPYVSVSELHDVCCHVRTVIVSHVRIFLLNNWISEIITQLYQVETFNHIEFKWD